MNIAREVGSFLIAKFEFFAAKSDRKQGRYWLPVWMHCMDVAGIMEKLAEEWLSISIYEQLQVACGGNLSKVCRFIGLAHDIGKITQAFQLRISYSLPSLRDDLLNHGFELVSYLSNEKESLHALAGECILHEFGVPSSIACIIGSHHGKPTTNPYHNMEYQSENYYGMSKNYDQWSSVWRAYFDWSLQESGYNSVFDLPELNVQYQILLTGLLEAADWMASNTRYFRLIGVSSYGDVDMYPYRIENAWEILGLPNRVNWSGGMTDADFYNEFHFHPNEIQQMMYETISNAITSGLYILEAPMGCGKTEAALAATDVFIGNQMAGGVFFGLPTQATANGIFPRLLDWAKLISIFDKHTIRLAHGMTAFNDSYMSVFHGTANVDFDSDDNILVHPWFEGNKQALLADFTIGTVDQVLFGALQQKHFMMRHLGLAGKVIIIDECHAYDAYMLEFLNTILQWLGKYQVPVILLSATLPYNRRKVFVESYLGQKDLLSDVVNWDVSNGYPLLTYTDNGCVFQKTIDCKSIVEKQVQITSMIESDMVNILKQKLAFGGCATVIVNTVAYAEYLACSLKCAFPNFRIILMHSGFIASDRVRIENCILELLGKEKNGESKAAVRNGVILVGTQVLEQSLDYDTDFMISELCPMDLLLQRMGRLHRHKRDYRPDNLKQPEFSVLVPENDKAKKGTEYIYTKWLLHKTQEFLPDKVVLPNDISELVQSVYAVKDDSMEYDAYNKRNVDAKNRANTKCLKIPKESKRRRQPANMHGMLDAALVLKSDVDASCCVRDTVSSIDVLAVWQDSNQKIHLFTGDLVFDLTQIPDNESARIIAGQKLSLPSTFLYYRYDVTVYELLNITKSMFGEWLKSSWLEDELFLVFDENGFVNLAGILLQYTSEIGLQIISKKG